MDPLDTHIHVSRSCVNENGMVISVEANIGVATAEILMKAPDGEVVWEITPLEFRTLHKVMSLVACRLDDDNSLPEHRVRDVE